jgi:hypothetical protein
VAVGAIGGIVMLGEFMHFRSHAQDGDSMHFGWPKIPRPNCRAPPHGDWQSRPPITLLDSVVSSPDGPSASGLEILEAGSDARRRQRAARDAMAPLVGPWVQVIAGVLELPFDSQVGRPPRPSAPGTAGVWAQHGGT